MRRLIIICKCTILVTLLASNAVGQTTPSQSRSSVDIDRQRLDFERQNEERKNRTELIKSAIAGFSLVLPLCFGIYTLRSQARQAFELKAAELVMNAPSVFAVEKKARILRTIFAAKIPRDFAAAFNPKDFATAGPSVESKLELLKLIVANFEREAEVVDLWRRMYPGDSLEQLFPGDQVHASRLHVKADTPIMSSNVAPAPPPP